MYILLISALVAVASADRLLFKPRSSFAIVCPDKRHECPTGNTCCILPTKEYGCCPAPNAVCCPGGKYCCPGGSQCLPSGQCKKGTEVFTSLLKTKAKLISQPKDTSVIYSPVKVTEFGKRPQFHNLSPIQTGSVICPDQESECADGQTCCKLDSGEYGCCPLPDAVCCSDGKHCCPHGSTCELAVQKCKSENGFVDLFEKVSAKKTTSVMCPDGKSECSDGDTCCPMDGGKYGCCPTADAKCCSDHIHCCPSGYMCDEIHQQCIGRHGKRIRWIKTVPSRSNAIDSLTIPNVVCPDGQSNCKTGQTCCKLASGNYGCCPIPKAVCCSDGRHCCPEGTTCDVASGTCNRGDLVVMDWFEKEAASVEMVKCPDGRSECKSEQTCCKLASGNYGCCPIPKAVCCSDGRHCCPDGTTCDVTSGKCLKQDGGLTEWFAKVAAKSKSIICPDDVTLCKSGQTCCKNDKGYLCCPLPMAVCCSDQRHCCPHGTTCNITNKGCDPTHTHSPSLVARKPLISLTKPKDGIFLPVNHDASHPVLSLQGSATTITCPDGQTTCPDTNGVCCTNSNFCCPHKYVCDEEPGICRIPFTYGLVNMAKPIRGTPLN